MAIQVSWRSYIYCCCMLYVVVCKTYVRVSYFDCHRFHAVTKLPSAVWSATVSELKAVPTSTKGTILGRPCAHMNGNTHLHNLLTNSLHCSVLSSSLNMIADRHARELTRSIRPSGQLEIRLTQATASLEDVSRRSTSSTEGGKWSASAYFQRAVRRKAMRTCGSALHRSDGLCAALPSS